MRIGTAPYLPMQPFRVKPERAADGIADEAQKEPADAKQTAREAMLRQLADMRAAWTSRGEDNPRVQQLIDKFKSGRQLAPDEMAYLGCHAPGMMEWIRRVSAEREMVELGMRIAPTKSDVQMAVLIASSRKVRRENAEDTLVRARHFVDAHAQYMKTTEYKKKPVR